MPRIRSLKPGFFRNEYLCALPFQHRLLFQGLWLHADKKGRLEDRPVRLASDIFPFDRQLDVNAMLDELAGADSGNADPFIVRYQVDGRRFIQVCSFTAHQRPHHTEPDSVIPERPESAAAPDLGAKTQTPDKVRETTVVAGISQDSKGREGKGVQEGKGTDVCAEPPSVSTPSAVVLIYPTSGKPQEWALTQAQIDEWADLYPNVAVEGEAKKALAWVKADLQRKKTAGGMPRFLVNWLNNAVRRGDTRPVSRPVAVDEEDWFDVCQRLHAGACGGRLKHSNRMAAEAEKRRHA